MDTYRAYCSACDAEVEVGFEEAGAGARPVHVRCLGRHAGCEGKGCPLPEGPVEDAEADIGSRLRRHLEFLPLSIRNRPPRNLAESALLVEEARRASLARQFRHWRP